MPIKRMQMNRLASLALAIALFASPALADPSPEDRASVQKVINGQIEALHRDDGAGAFAYAADAIRTMFQSPDAFLDMVRRGYAPVYRQKSFVFGSLTEDDSGLVQEVLITDEQGRDWVARYLLTKAEDGGWRISGCTLVQNEGVTI